MYAFALSCLFSCVLGASDTLASLALQKVLQDAAPVFGVYKNVQSNTSTWMSTKPDSLPIVQMVRSPASIVQ